MKIIRSIILLIAALSLFFAHASSQVRILTIGDSTMANYDEEKNSGEKEMRGWAQMFSVFTKDNVRVDNAAKNGRSSKSFYLEFWKELRETLKPGDYVFIQFGHNDEKFNGLDDEIGSPKRRGTAAWGQYQDFLTIYVNESRERGAIPILFTPVVRRLFNDDNIIIGVGLHNLNEIAGNDSLMNYPLAMKTLAKKLNVPLVDMTTLTQNLVEAYGAEKAKEVIYAKNDNTHLKAMGGILFSRLAAEELLKQNILIDYLNVASGISIKPGNYDFGGQFIGKYKTKSFSIIGMDLEPNSGQISFSLPVPFSISKTLNDADFSPAVVVEYNNGNINTPVYVKYSPTTETENNAEIKVVVDGKNSQSINISGYGKSEKAGKTANSMWYPSTNKNNCSKGLSCNSNVVGMKPISQNSNTYYTITEDTWPAGDIDVNTERYLEYTVSPNKEVLYINKVSFETGSIGGKGMFCTVLGSTDPTFSKTETFVIMESLQDKITKEYTFDTFIKVKKGERFYLRIYPWYKTAAKDKSIQLNSVHINGLLFKK